MKLNPQAVFPLAVFAGLSLAFLAAREGSRAVPEPALLPRGLIAAPIARAQAGYEQPADCRGCHQAEWQAWKMSRHSHAAVGQLFAVGFRVEPMRWCLTCHSPEEPDPDRALAAGDGVTCAACHNRADGIASAKPPAQWGSSPHRLVYDPGLRSGTTCADCHQSDIPLSRNINQDTMDEWTRAGGAKLGQCVSCHMPSAPGTGHQFVATRDRAFLARSIPVAARAVAGELEIAIGPAQTGHDIPTGDPFRELALAWKITDAAGAQVAAGEELLGRRSRVVTDADGHRKMLEKDERLGVGQRKTFCHALPKAKGTYQIEVRAMLRLMAAEMTKLKSFPGFQVETEFAVQRLSVRVE